MLAYFDAETRKYSKECKYTYSKRVALGTENFTKYVEVLGEDRTKASRTTD
ncbi:hypothetical protein HMPREF9954_1892 [Streptococcus infantis SK970]|nr:hypothetical protein HMPREF9954_1892 [Streptococcus infantis SK970]